MEAQAATVAQIVTELQRRLDDRQRRKGEGTFGDHLAHVPYIICADGLGMSVQASAYHYCQPRESRGPWWCVEVGFPTREVAEIRDYMEDWGDTKPTEAVYGYVPIEKVAEAIVAAGGFAPDEEAQRAAFAEAEGRS